MRCCRRIWAGLAIALTLYFGVGAWVLHFVVEDHVVVRGSLPSSAMGQDKLSFTSATGRFLSARTVGSGLSGCTVIFPGQHGPSPQYEQAVVPLLVERGVRVYLLAYPGQSGTEAGASLREIRHLSRLALAQIAQQCPPSKLVVVGRSLGAMVAAYAAPAGHPSGLVLEAASPSFSTAIRRRLNARWYLRPLLGLPIERLLSENYSLSSALCCGQMPPTVVFQGTRDTQAPLEDLAWPGALPHNVKLVSIADATHSNVFLLTLPQYVNTIMDMLKGSSTPSGH
jgi:predicted alpha/beta-hydrolase family hydrolase